MADGRRGTRAARTTREELVRAPRSRLIELRREQRGVVQARWDAARIAEVMISDPNSYQILALSRDAAATFGEPPPTILVSASDGVRSATWIARIPSIP